MGEYAMKGDVHWHKHYNGKIRENNILRTDDIEGASSRQKIYDKTQLRDRILTKQSVVTQSGDLRRDREKAYVNPITHGIFHEYQGRRPAAVHMSLQSQLNEQPTLRYDMPPNGAKIRNPMFNDYSYSSPYGSPTDVKGYGSNVTDSLDSFQKQYDTKRGYGGQPQQQQDNQGYGQQYSQGYGQQYKQNYGQQQQGNFQSNIPKDEALEGNINNFYAIDTPQNSKSLAKPEQKPQGNFEYNASNFYGSDEGPKEAPKNNNYEKNYENFFRGYTPTEKDRLNKPTFAEHFENPKNPMTKKEIFTYDPIKGTGHLKYQKPANSIAHKANDPMNQPIQEKWKLNVNANKFF